MDKEKLIVIAGPTASGKSAAAIELAKRLDGSVISADSMQVYKGINIGSAKVTKKQMQGVAHYLIDIREPYEEWNVVCFQKEAKEAFGKITSEGKLPILAGGTGFYIQSLIYDIDFTETVQDEAYRKELLAIEEKEGEGALHALLEKVDPLSAQAIHPRNIKRIIRALEYYHERGESIEVHNREQRKRETPYDLQFFVLTMDREKLYARIQKRVDRMMEAGLLDEVIRLRGQGLTKEDVSMQGLGYRQLLDYLDGICSLEEAVEEIKKQTRHYAKRQLTWFRRERNVTWIQTDSFSSRQSMYDSMEEMIRKRYGLRRT